MTDTESLKALVALAQKFRSGRWMIVSDWNRYAVMEENHPHERFVCTFNQKPVSMQGRKLDPVDYCGADRTTAEFIAAAKNAIPHLKALLGEQREAQGEEYSRAINDVISIVAEMKESHTGYWADYLLGRLGMMASSAPPLAESVDVEALAKELIITFVDANNYGYYRAGVESVIRRHMQQEPKP